MRCLTTSLTFFFLLGLLLTTIGCQPAAETAPPAPLRRVESVALGLVIGNLPESLEVVVNEGETLQFAPSDPARGGQLTLTLDAEEQGGINLVQACRDHQAAIEARGGTYSGQRELGWQYGTAFYSRGTYQVDGAAIEETSVFVIHPTRDQRLRLVYSYPAGGSPEDTGKRLEEDLFGVLGEIEPLQETPAS